MLLLGSHVGMSGKDMLVNSVKEALSYDANTFMVYTGAPQNTRRKDISELCIPQARKLMEEHDMANFIVHAPYIINLANTVKPETYELAVTFLAKEIERTASMGATVLVLHPGAHVGAGAEAGIAQICKGLNEVLNEDTPVFIALETMAGKGTEIGRSFEELKAIYDGCNHPDKLRVCFDTCHVNDAGYDLVNDYENVMNEFDKRETVVRGCSSGETLTFTHLLQILSSNKSHELGDDFNYKFIRINNEYGNTLNKLTFNLPCTYSISYNPIAKVVIA